jgi:hypothetical protein
LTCDGDATQEPARNWIVAKSASHTEQPLKNLKRFQFPDSNHRSSKQKVQAQKVNLFNVPANEMTAFVLRMLSGSPLTLSSLKVHSPFRSLKPNCNSNCAGSNIRDTRSFDPLFRNDMTAWHSDMRQEFIFEIKVGGKARSPTYRLHTHTEAR